MFQCSFDVSFYSSCLDMFLLSLQKHGRPCLNQGTSHPVISLHTMLWNKIKLAESNLILTTLCWILFIFLLACRVLKIQYSITHFGKLLGIEVRLIDL